MPVVPVAPTLTGKTRIESTPNTKHITNSSSPAVFHAGTLDDPSTTVSPIEKD